MRLDLEVGFVVTNIEHGSAEWIYDAFYCACEQAENFIKLHKSQRTSGHTSYRYRQPTRTGSHVGPPD